MEEIRFNQPPREVPVEEDNNKKKRNFNPLLKKTLKMLAVIAILGAVILLAFFGKEALGGIFKSKSENYSAVFLTNGQVYFGKMVKNNEKEITLNNVFYIQINENAGKEEIANAINQARFNLVKLGNELHGPTDELFINKSQVVFYEKLRDDSKVVESIKNYKQ
ncbi:MAG: hypothetical protein AAB837_00010 [Patescibacteria group bacterium]